MRYPATLLDRVVKMHFLENGKQFPKFETIHINYQLFEFPYFDFNFFFDAKQKTFAGKLYKTINVSS